MVFRRTRLRWMYIPRLAQKEKKDHPLQVQRSEDFLRISFIVAGFTIIASGFMALRQVQKRERQSEKEQLRIRSGQKVVIVGGGAAGCALAATLVNGAPNMHVTVVEKDKQQVFQGHFALAHVGHRSYDLGTTTGVDILRSPATWNVTREANLVAAEVFQVDPEKRKVYVQTTPAMLAAAQPLHEMEQHRFLEEGSAAQSKESFPSRVLGWWRSAAAASPSVISMNADGSANLADGTTMFAYDALVVAAGAQRTLGNLRAHIQPQQLDSYRIALNPGSTRDNLVNLFMGTVVYLKVPPASFVEQMEAARTVLYGASKSNRTQKKRDHRTCSHIDFADVSAAAAPSPAASAASKNKYTATTTETRTTLPSSFVTEEPTPFTHASTWLLSLLRSARVTFSAAGRPTHHFGVEGVSNSGDGVSSVIPDEIARRLSSSSSSPTSSLTGISPGTSPTLPSTSAAAAAAPLPLFFLSQWCMHFSSRQHDSTFVSSTNAIWKFLAFFNKLSLSHFVAVTADTAPIGPAPSNVNAALEEFWRERQVECLQGAETDVNAVRFHVLLHSYATAVDTAANVLTLYDYKHHCEVRLPYHLLVLDLPLRAPSFVRRSGLHRLNYVKEQVLPALAEGTRTVADPRAAVDRNISDTSAASAPTSARSALQTHPLLGKAEAELEVMFDDEMSFVDVDPVTLQHRRHSNIFAVGDVAGLPSVKSYGAAFTQVPVVAHNVQQVLEAQRIHDEKLQAPPQTHTSTERLPQPNALYTGYSSFHVVMTTWRGMWPEMRYNDDPYAQEHGKGTLLLPEKREKEKNTEEHHPEARQQRSTDAAVLTSPAADTFQATVKPSQSREWDLATPLAYCNHHVWNNLAWRDGRGFLNGFYYQCSLYEIMYFFVFSRGLWHSPTWFKVPTYSPLDGTPHLPSLSDFL